MEAAKFTPDPWELAQDGSAFLFALNGRGMNRFFASVQSGFDADGKRTSQEELRANAVLMWAAPDLLDAAQLVADTASQEWQDSTGKRMAATDNQGRRFWFITEEIMQVVREAVAKASS